ncbi:MAG: FecCD family ABC transporter permease [Geminicoccaceae bacterium]
MTADSYRRLHRHRLLILALLVLLLLVLLAVDLVVGPSATSSADLLRAVLQPDSVPRPVSVIVWQIRLPTALTAVLVGAGLALAGAEMQTIHDNPLADPFILGVASAASLGAALVIVLGIGIPGVSANWVLPANAFLLAVGAVALLQLMSRLRGGGSESLVLFGIALVFAFNAAVALLQFVASDQALQQLVFWQMGSLARSSWPRLGILLLVLALTFPFSMRAAWQLTVLRLGEERALSLGVDVPRLRLFSLLRVSLLTATAVAFVGTIGFIGLIGPHMARLLVGEDHRYFLPASLLAGAVLLSASSIASKAIVPGLLVPVGIVTALVGVPAFLAIVVGRRRPA